MFLDSRRWKEVRKRPTRLQLFTKKGNMTGRESLTGKLYCNPENLICININFPSVAQSTLHAVMYLSSSALLGGLYCWLCAVDENTKAHRVYLTHPHR